VNFKLHANLNLINYYSNQQLSYYSWINDDLHRMKNFTFSQIKYGYIAHELNKSNVHIIIFF
jgi:hypothetical protein